MPKIKYNLTVSYIVQVEAANPQDAKDQVADMDLPDNYVTDTFSIDSCLPAKG